MSRVLLCGAFGQDNPGDDALLEAFLVALADHSVVVPGTPTIGLRSDGAAPTWIPPTATAVGRAVRSVDAVVVAGGTIFKTLHRGVGRHHLGLLARTRLLQAGARGHGIPVALVGVGAGELRSRAAVVAARSVAARADLLILRDEESAAVLRGIGAPGPFRIGADPAWTTFGAAPDEGDGRRHGVVIAISHLAGRDRVDVADRLVHLVEPLLARGVAVRLQPWQAGGGEDRIVAELLHHRTGGGLVTVVDRPRSLHDAVDCFRRASAVVGVRHHSLLAAAEAGCPFLAVSHEPKLAALARRLRQRSVPAHAPAAVLAQSAVRLLSYPAPDPALVAQEKVAAAQSMRLLRVVVSGGAHDETLDRDQLALTTRGVPW